MQENENKTIFSETQTDNNSVAVFNDAKIVERPKTTKEKITSASKTKSASGTKKTNSAKINRTAPFCVSKHHRPSPAPS